MKDQAKINALCKKALDFETDNVHFGPMHYKYLTKNINANNKINNMESIALWKKCISASKNLQADEKKQTQKFIDHVEKQAGNFKSEWKKDDAKIVKTEKLSSQKLQTSWKNSLKPNSRYVSLAAIGEFSSDHT